jgi:hypothetical protein
MKDECVLYTINPPLYTHMRAHAQLLETSGKRINDISAPLAQASISIFYLSTYHTDFLFVKERRLAQLRSPFPLFRTLF